MALFLNNNEIEEIPIIQNNELRNRSNSEILHDHKPATQINTNTGNKNFFPLLFLLDFNLTPPIRLLRIRFSFELLRAIWPRKELKGSAQTMICWGFGGGWDCEMRNGLRLQRRESMLSFEIGNGKVRFEIEGKDWVVKM
ncbi:hypothetical protein TSUD_34340 [Trifolium subterraneum]|uniref:Uncharacterized protein n=1 Tax=Trifolium subterraneum TaxID=3900 RepID=A0A2Z6P0V6_TRISU|nr:hypothetical protein TSUD_34340 [Trifolium subterraneum]